jgi:hypothetical protein
VDIGPDSATRVFELPDIDGLSSVYFVRLNLQDNARKLVSFNFYWLSTQPDISDFAASNGKVFGCISAAGDIDAADRVGAGCVARLAAGRDLELSEEADSLWSAPISPKMRIAQGFWG